ncbi:MAG: hypothetical protein Q7S08_02735 [bacterium]|nr:hypothetical protein [bacterium]
MPPTKKILQYAIALAVILLLAGLAGWYYFLKEQGQAITATDAGRGLDSNPPSFGSGTGSTYSNVSDTDSPTSPEGRTKAPPRLWRVTKTPVAGMGFVKTAKNTASSVATSSSLLYFAERGTGYILKADTSTGSLTRLTNKLFPRIYEAVFDSLGDAVLRSIDNGGNITSFAGNVRDQNALASSSPNKSAGSSGTTAFSGQYLESNILAAATSQGTRELLLLVPGENGGSDVVLSSWDGAKQKTLFSSPLSGWKLFSLSDGRIFLSTLPSDGVAGYAFEIQNGALVPRLRNIPGLTFLPRTLSGAALFGQSVGGDVSLFFSPKEGAGAVYLPIRTVADKCVWAPPAIPPSGKKAKADSGPPVVAGPVDGLLIAYCAVPNNFASKSFLTDWYMGTTHTSDTWWRVDASTGQVTPLLEPGDTEQTFDVENPTIDSAGEQIAFMDAGDKSLWLLKINAK